MIHTSNQ